MIFLHPEYLWGLLAIVIPIIIHLFDFRKNTKVYFPDIRFLKQVKHSSRKPLKLKQLLILVSRIGFISFLVFVFAQPILPSSQKNKTTVGTKVIYIDNSQSMSALVSAKETALERARFITQTILEKLPKGQEVIVLDNEKIKQFLAPISIKEASQKISAVNLSEIPFSFNQLSMVLNEYQKREKTLSDVFVLSDFQKASSEINHTQLDTALTYWLSPIKTETVSNCVVDSVFQITSSTTNEESFQIEVVVQNTGAQVKQDLPVKIFIGNRQVSAATISIPAYQKKSLSFFLGNINNVEAGYIQIEDYPNSFDNIFYFTVPKKKLLNILEITGENPSSYVNQVFGNEHLFSVKQSDFRNIDYALFDKSDFVVLNQINKPELDLVEKIKMFTASGGSVLVIPGNKVDANAYLSLSSLIINEPIFRKQKLQEPAKNDPFFANVFENTSRIIEMPKMSSVWNWGQDRSAILSFEDGSPLLSELSANLFFIRTPLVDSLSDLQTHALFVPLMYRLASHSMIVNNQLFARINNDYFDIELDSVDYKDIIKLKKDEIEIIPEKVKVGNKWRLSFPKEMINTGIYEVTINQKTQNYLSLNLNQEESLLEPLSTENIKEQFEGLDVNFLDSFNPTSKINNVFEGGIALWKYVLVICLLFLLSEALLIRLL